jgi:hypothetical protein
VPAIDLDCGAETPQSALQLGRLDRLLQQVTTAGLDLVRAIRGGSASDDREVASQTAQPRGVEFMLELTESNTPSQIRVEFPGGAHAGESYAARLSCCDNPICTCTRLHFDLFRDLEGEGESSLPEYRFEVDIRTKAANSTAESSNECDRNMSRAIVEQLTEDDWHLLWKLYYRQKRKATDATPDRELKTHFPAAEIEGSGLMVAFHDILPFGASLIADIDGQHILLGDQYCVRPGCACTDAMVLLFETEGSRQDTNEQYPAALKIDYRSRRCQVESRGGEDPALLRTLAKELVAEETCSRLEARHNRLRSLYLMYKHTHRRPVRPSAPKVGRNDPCPCGSGKKHKKCCMPGR